MARYNAGNTYRSFPATGVVSPREERDQSKTGEGKGQSFSRAEQYIAGQKKITLLL